MGAWMITDLLGFFDATLSDAFRGLGFFAGLAPTSSNPNDPASIDGRFRIRNVPSQGRIVVLERDSLLPVASTLSALDGTWRINWLDPAKTFLVIGFDDRRQENAAIQDFAQPAPMV
jgi:hypothetical protein